MAAVAFWTVSPTTVGTGTSAGPLDTLTVITEGTGRVDPAGGVVEMTFPAPTVVEYAWASFTVSPSAPRVAATCVYDCPLYVATCTGCRPSETATRIVAP